MACKEPKRIVSDEEYQSYLQNPNVTDMIKAETLVYRTILDKSEREEAGLIALWKAIQEFKPEYKQKFTTSLHRFIHWECLRAIRTKKRRIARERREGTDVRELEHTIPLYNRHDNDRELRQLVREQIDRLPEDQKRVIIQYYYERRSIAEIAHINGFSKQSTRLQLRRGEARIAELFDGVNPLGSYQHD